jgi:hypothetical protein
VQAVVKAVATQAIAGLTAVGDGEKKAKDKGDKAGKKEGKKKAKKEDRDDL